MELGSLGDAGALSGTQYTAVSQSGMTKRCTLNTLSAWLQTVLPYSTLPTTSGNALNVLRANAAGTGIEWTNVMPGEPVVTKTGSYTPVAGTDRFIIVTPSGAVTMTLPTAVGWTGYRFTFKRTNGTGVVTFNTTSGQTIDGNASGVLTLAATANLHMTVVSDGANWWRLDN